MYDIPNKKISTLLAFSQGHWEHAEEAPGDKRDAKTFERWRGLAKIGKQSMYFPCRQYIEGRAYADVLVADRFMLSEQADILEAFKGKGDLVPIDPGAETL